MPELRWMGVKVSQPYHQYFESFPFQNKARLHWWIIVGIFFPDIMNEYQAVMEAMKKLRNCPFAHFKGWENIQSPHKDNTIRELVLKHLNVKCISTVLCTTDVLFN